MYNMQCPIYSPYLTFVSSMLQPPLHAASSTTCSLLHYMQPPLPQYTYTR